MGQLLEGIAKRCPGGILPTRYLVFDTETGGFSPEKHRIVQVGFCFVRDKQVVDSFAQVIQRPADYHMSPEAIAVHKITHERMVKEGVPHTEMIPTTVQMMTEWRAEGGMFMGHNMMNFDAPFLEFEANLLGCPFKFADNEIIDTGMLVKASLLNMPFRDDKETLRSFYKRVSEVRAAGVKWSLDRYCFDAYNLVKYGVGKDTAHDAGVDCQLTHFLFQELMLRAA